MRTITLLFVATSAGPAMAHPGHLIELAGHNHWLAGAAIGAAMAIGLLQGLKGKPTEDPENIDGEEPQEA